jgi:nucleotide-binding universal stress UspA family protein
MMYQKIVAALDGSLCSNMAIDAALSLAQNSPGTELTGVHVYAAKLHRSRFEQMEPGLSQNYQEKDRLDSLRQTHENLITEGMHLISDSFISPLMQASQKLNIACSGAAPEGHHYIELLKLIKDAKIDLVVMGAHGHGKVAESSLGSLAERTLLGNNRSDLLLMRSPWNFKNRPILVGIDGSQDSFFALQRALQIAKTIDARVEAVAVYDPFFHNGIFNVISSTLPQQAQERFNFPAQEKLHDEIIDVGLEKLYQEGLDRAKLIAQQMNSQIKTILLCGKVFSQIFHQAHICNASLVVVGKFGLHREVTSLAGSNTMNLSRQLVQNLLVVAPPENDLQLPDLLHQQESLPLNWTSEAESALERMPVFARKMARRAIENKARQSGVTIISAEFVQSQNPMAKKI